MASRVIVYIQCRKSTCLSSVYLLLRQRYTTNKLQNELQSGKLLLKYTKNTKKFILFVPFLMGLSLSQTFFLGPGTMTEVSRETCLLHCDIPVLSSEQLITMGGASYFASIASVLLKLHQELWDLGHANFTHQWVFSKPGLWSFHLERNHKILHSYYGIQDILCK